MARSGFLNSIVVVSGAGSGIGRQLALQAAARAAKVFATDINAKGLEETREAGRKHQLDIEIHQLDVADKEATFSFADKVIPLLEGRRLILINNAGVSLCSGGFQHTELEDFARLLNINLWGTIYLTKAFYPYFLERNEGHIVNLSSVFGLMGVANQAAYCTSKFAIRGFTETLRMELQGTGIRTTCVHPGGIKTNIVRAAPPKGTLATDAMHRKLVKSFDRMALTTADKAARLILNAVEKKKQRLLIGPDGKGLDWVTRLFPVLYTSLLKRQLGKSLDES